MGSDWTGATMFQYEDFRKFIHTIKEPKFMVAYMLTFFTGLRAGEVCSLKREDFDFKNKVIRLKQGKTGRRNVDIVNDKLILLLQKWFELLGEEEYLLPSRQIKIPHMLPKSLSRQFRKDVKKAGLDHAYKKRKDGTTLYQYKFHALRHAYCSIGAEFNIPPEIIQRQLGHTSIRTTMDVYAHLSKRRTRHELQKIWNPKDRITEAAQEQSNLTKKPLEILNERFAKGDITAEEYAQRKGMLMG